MRARLKLSLLTLTATASLVLCGCQPAQIAYEQVGACQAGDHLAFVVFRITGIDNSQGAADFDYKPSRLYVAHGLTGDNARINDAFNQGAILCESVIWTPATKAHNVAVGTNDTTPGCGVTMVDTGDVDGAREASKTSYFLNYETPSGESVSLVKSDPTRVEWAYTPNCNDVPYPK